MRNTLGHLLAGFLLPPTSSVTITREVLHRGEPRQSPAGNTVAQCGTLLTHFLVAPANIVAVSDHGWYRPCARCFGHRPHFRTDGNGGVVISVRAPTAVVAFDLVADGLPPDARITGLQRDSEGRHGSWRVQISGLNVRSRLSATDAREDESRAMGAIGEGFSRSVVQDQTGPPAG